MTAHQSQFYRSSFIAAAFLIPLAGCQQEEIQAWQPSAPRECTALETKVSTSNRCLCQKDNAAFSPKGEISEGTWVPSPDGTLEAGWNEKGNLIIRNHKTGVVLRDFGDVQPKLLAWHPDGDMILTANHGSSNGPEPGYTSFRVYSIYSNEVVERKYVSDFMHAAIFDPDQPDHIIYGQGCEFGTQRVRILREDG